jgi:O-antigen/teichoic acid export membrane protein
VRERQSGHFRSVIFRASALFAAGGAVYWLFLAWWGEAAMRVLYRGQYADVQHLVPILGALPLVAAVVALLTAALQALERPDQTMIAWASAATLCATLGVWLAYRWQVAGAIAGMTIGFGAAALAMAWSFRRIAPRHIPGIERLAQERGIYSDPVNALDTEYQRLKYDA